MQTWGAEIWDQKVKSQSDISVILGTGFTRWHLQKNTKKTLAALSKGLLSHVPDGADLLDVGVGPSARLAIELTHRGYKVTGFDASRVALEKAAFAVSERGLSPIKLALGNMTELDLGKKFDGIYCVESFFHLPAHLAVKAFTQFNKHLDIGGRLFVQFSIQNELTLSFLLKSLAYLSAYRCLSPILSKFKRPSFYVTVSRNTEAEIVDIARLTGFDLGDTMGDYFSFVKRHDPS